MIVIVVDSPSTAKALLTTGASRTWSTISHPAAILDVLVARDLRDAADIEAGKVTLERIVSMLIRLVQSIDEEGRSAEAGQRSRS